MGVLNPRGTAIGRAPPHRGHTGRITWPIESVESSRLERLVASWGVVSAYCETPEGAAMSGCWYFTSRGCVPLAESWQLSEITLKVNGTKMLGNAQRIAYSNAMLKALGG
jgi:hypothetical protein